jgi:hypothetical protein
VQGLAEDIFGAVTDEALGQGIGRDPPSLINMGVNGLLHYGLHTGTGLLTHAAAISGAAVTGPIFVASMIA